MPKKHSYMPEEQIYGRGVRSYAREELIYGGRARSYARGAQLYGREEPIYGGRARLYDTGMNIFPLISITLKYVMSLANLPDSSLGKLSKYKMVNNWELHFLNYNKIPNCLCGKQTS